MTIVLVTLVAVEPLESSFFKKLGVRWTMGTIYLETFDAIDIPFPSTLQAMSGEAEGTADWMWTGCVAKYENENPAVGETGACASTFSSPCRPRPRSRSGPNLGPRWLREEQRGSRTRGRRIILQQLSRPKTKKGKVRKFYIDGPDAWPGANWRDGWDDRKTGSISHTTPLLSSHARRTASPHRSSFSQTGTRNDTSASGIQ